MTSSFLPFLFAGLVGGAVNAAAGGAKLCVFPLLLATGLPPIAANVTQGVALWPAPLPAVWVYRRELMGGIVGGYVGASVTRRLPDGLLRVGVAGLGLVLTLSFL